MVIFFDIDNTLLNHDKAVKKACLAIQNKFSDKKMSPDDFLQIWNEATDEFFNQYLNGKITHQEQRWLRVAKVFELDKNPMKNEIFNEIIQLYLDEYEKNWHLYPEAKSCLEKLKNYQLGIISNGDFFQQTKKLKITGIERYFKSINISGKVGFAKPRREIFEYACNTLKSDPKDCVYVGDKLEDDAMACEKIGMTGVWINRKGEEKNSGNLKVIRSLNELFRIL